MCQNKNWQQSFDKSTKFKSLLNQVNNLKIFIYRMRQPKIKWTERMLAIIEQYKVSIF